MNAHSLSRFSATRAAPKAFAQVETKLGGLQSAISKAGAAAGGFLAAQGITASLETGTNFLGDSQRAATDLSESLNAVGKIFETPLPPLPSGARRTRTPSG